MNLVYYIIHREYPTFSKDEDLRQCAMLGLCQAAENWDSEKSMFSTFAGKCIRNEINKEFIRRKAHSRNISLETQVADDLVIGDMLEGESCDSIGVEDSFLNYISEEDRRVFKLKNLGLSTAEIADVTGYSIPNVQKRLRLIKYTWRKYVGD